MKPLAEVINDLIDAWHDAPAALVGPFGPAREEEQRGVDLHHFLGMSWDEYANWRGPRSDGFPARLEPYVRAQHARWVAVPDRAAALRDVETLLRSVWAERAYEIGRWCFEDDPHEISYTDDEFAALIVDRVLGAEQDGGAASS